MSLWSHLPQLQLDTKYSALVVRGGILNQPFSPGEEMKIQESQVTKAHQEWQVEHAKQLMHQECW